MQTWAAVMMKEVPTRFLNWRQIWTHLGGAWVKWLELTAACVQI